MKTLNTPVKFCAQRITHCALELLTLFNMLLVNCGTAIEIAFKPNQDNIILLKYVQQLYIKYNNIKEKFKNMIFNCVKETLIELAPIGCVNMFKYSAAEPYTAVKHIKTQKQ